MAVFDRGDVVRVPLDPAIGHEQRGTRPALVLTTKEFLTRKQKGTRIT
jgi:mRNA interferase ChpB